MQRTVKFTKIDYAKIVFTPEKGAELITSTKNIFDAGHDVGTALKILFKQEGKAIQPISYQYCERLYTMPDEEFFTVAKIESETANETHFI